MILSTRIKAIAALFVTGILGGIAPLLMKIALRELSSYQILFIRFGLVSLFVSPLFVTHLRSMSFRTIKSVLPASLLFCGNVFFFIVGVQYTTSIVSQLFFLLTPVIVSLFGYLFFKEKISMRRILSMIMCFAGSSLLILRSVQSGALVKSIGTLQGNILILCAVLSWGFYVIYTKRISGKFKPFQFLTSNFLTAFLLSVVALQLNNSSPVATLYQFVNSTPAAIFSLIALGLVNSVLFFFLYQWSIKHVSAFIVSSTTYLSPLSAALFAIPFLGEQLSATLLISTFGIFAGSYLILTERK